MSFVELETYGAVVSTLRAQGELNKDRRKLLEDLSVLMKISPERHKAEIRRAVNDEKLGCIAERLVVLHFNMSRLCFLPNLTYFIILHQKYQVFH